MIRILIAILLFFAAALEVTPRTLPFFIGPPKTSSKPPPDAQTRRRNAVDVAEARALLDSWEGDPDVLQAAHGKLRKALADDPEHVQAHKELARYLIMVGNDREDAAQYLRAADQELAHALRIDPQFAGAYVLYGHLYRLMGKTGPAIEALKKARALGTDDPWLYNNAADIFAAGMRCEEARTLYRHVLRMSGTTKKARDKAYGGIADCYYHENNPAAADAAYRQLIAFNPSAWNYTAYGYFLFCMKGDFDAAYDTGRAAMQAMDHGWAHIIMAAALYAKAYKTGPREQSEALRAQAHEIYPYDDDLRARVSGCRCEKGVIAGMQQR